jgi:hypothetical protein
MSSVISSLRLFDLKSPSLISRTATEIIFRDKSKSPLSIEVIILLINNLQRLQFYFPSAFIEKTATPVAIIYHHHVLSSCPYVLIQYATTKVRCYGTVRGHFAGWKNKHRSHLFSLSIDNIMEFY